MTDEKKIPQRIYVKDSQLTQCEVDGVADVRINATPFKMQKGKLCEYVNLKVLWHTEKEIPEANRPILVKDWKLKDRYSTFDTTEDLNLEDFDKELQWECFCKLANLDFTWCYIEDLLPKGGEK